MRDDVYGYINVWMTVNSLPVVQHHLIPCREKCIIAQMNRNADSPSHPTSVSHLTDALEAKWEQIPAARFQTQNPETRRMEAREAVD